MTQRFVRAYQHSAGANGGEPSQQAIGRSKGGLSTKIHATVNALGNPLSFHLTPAQASDLDGADKLLPDLAADSVLADKGYDANERVIERLQAQGKTAVIPPKRNRTKLRVYDKDLYKARHLLRTSSPSSSSIGRWRHVMTSGLPTFLVRFMWLLPLSG